jgi:hypothetical protein
MGFRVAANCGPFNLRAARIAEPEQACGLVEGLAGGVVDRATKPLEFERRPHVEERRMAAAGDESDAGVEPAIAVHEPRVGGTTDWPKLLSPQQITVPAVRSAVLEAFAAAGMTEPGFLDAVPAAGFGRAT